MGSIPSRDPDRGVIPLFFLQLTPPGGAFGESDRRPRIANADEPIDRLDVIELFAKDPPRRIPARAHLPRRVIRSALSRAAAAGCIAGVYRETASPKERAATVNRALP